MNIGAWPLPTEDAINSPLKHREITSKESNQLFWTKAFLQTNTYDEKRYRHIESNACERIIQAEESKNSSRPSSIIALSLSETSIRENSSKNHSTPQTITLPIEHRKDSSYTRFSCYLKSHHLINRPKQVRKKCSRKIPPKNNNSNYEKLKYSTSKKDISKLNKKSREKVCKKCSKLIQRSSTDFSSKTLCQSCCTFIQNSTSKISMKKFGLTKTEENELRQIIEIVIEEFQDHFSQALNLSIKQMTHHLLANINLFYNHYQHEFEQLTKKYRLAFLERFIELMKKLQIYQTKTHQFIPKIKRSISTRNSITHPPDILSMSSLSGSLATEKDPILTPSNSISLSTRSNRSIIVTEKTHSNNHRKYLPIQNSSSKKTFVTNRTGDRQTFNKICLRKSCDSSSHTDKSRNQTSSSIQLLDAYRFRDTLRMNNSRYSSPHPRIR